jgi:hypothetical protein
VRRLGLRVIPSLAHRDVFASGKDLERLASEVVVLQRSLRSVVDELLVSGVHIVCRGPAAPGVDMRDVSVDRTGQAQTDPYETVRVRLANIAEAVRIARSMPDGEVVIW